MLKISKRMLFIKNEIDKNIFYNLDESINLIKKTSKVNFIESLEICINLNIDIKKSNQSIIGYTSFIKGNGKKNCIGVIANENESKIAKDLGIIYVDKDVLLNKLKHKNKFIDIVLLSSNAIDIFNKYFKNILESKGLIPSHKMGTLTNNIEDSIKKFKLGQSLFRNDKNGIIHVLIGKLNFDNNHLKENIISLITNLNKLKPNKIKGEFIKSICLCSTMGINFKINKFDLI